MPAFPLRRVAGAEALRGLEISHGQRQFLVNLLAPHQKGTKQGRRCSHSTWSMNDLWAAFPWVYPARLASSVFRGTYCTHARTNVAGISRFGEVVRHSGLCEFHSCALCRIASYRGPFTKISFLPLALENTFSVITRAISSHKRYIHYLHQEAMKRILKQKSHPYEVYNKSYKVIKMTLVITQDSWP